MNWSEVFEYKKGELFWKIKIKKAKPGMVAGGRDSYGYRTTTYKCRTYKVHRIIWEIHFGEIPKNKVIDHINGRIENLRIANFKENNHNRKVSKRSKSGFKGVFPCHRNTPNKPWMALIMSNGKRFFIGAFKTKEEANEAYKAAAEKYHKSFSFKG